MNAFDSTHGSHAAALKRKSFTVAEANRALVLVKRIVADIIRDYGRLVELQEMIETAQAGGRYHGASQAQQAMVEVAQKLRCCAEEIEDMGVQLQDWSLGIVDFPCIADDREICLCWQYGEPRVEYWHELDAGFAGRQPIEALPIAPDMAELFEPTP